MAEPYVIRGPRVLVCEGAADKAFFSALIRQRNLPDFDIPFPQEHAPAADTLGGKSQFHDMLEAVRSVFPVTTITRILIVADAAHDETAAFRDVCAEIQRAGGFGVPTAPLQSATAPDHPTVVVMMVPGRGLPGGLETLCIRSLYGGRPEIRLCVEDYLRCANIAAWNAEKQDKARYQCFIAGTNRDDPNKALRYAFAGTTPIVSVADTCFDEIADAIRNVDGY